MNSSNANSTNANANTNANTNNTNIIATANGELVNASNGNVIVSNNSSNNTNLAMNGGDLEEEIMKKMKYPAIVIFSIMFLVSVVLLIFMFLEEEPVSRLKLFNRIFYATSSGIGVVFYSVLV